MFILLPKIRTRQRGAALVEFALVFPLLVLVIATIWEWGGFIREANVLIEATRHGARVAGGISADPSRGDWCALGSYDSDFISCTSTPVPSGLTGVYAASAQISLESVCQYLEVAGAQRDEWDVRFTVEESFPFSAFPLPPPFVNGSNGYAFRVSARRTVGSTRPCLVCLFGFFSDALKNEGTSVFPMQMRCP